MTTDPKTRDDIAATFRMLVADALADDLDEINERNASPRYRAIGACATHDFCDANDLMYEAFQANSIAAPSDFSWDTPEQNAATALWNAAWGKAVETPFAALSEGMLCDIYTDFLRRHEYPAQSADELLYEVCDADNAPVAWIRLFIQTWDKVVSPTSLVYCA